MELEGTDFNSSISSYYSSLLEDKNSSLQTLSLNTMSLCNGSLTFLNINCDQGQWVKWNNEKSTSFLVFSISVSHEGRPRWLSDNESACQCRRHRRREFNPWVRKIPWRREWQPAPIFLPGKSHGLVGYCPWCCKMLDMTEWLST